jgi:hypothetical protein
MTVVRAREPRVAGFGVSATAPARAAPQRVTTAADTRFPAERVEDVERVLERLASATVGPDAMTLGSSPTTSEMDRRRSAAGARREPAALDRRQVLAHGVQRVNVGARRSRRGRRALVVERDAVGRHRHQRRRAAGDQDEQRLVALERRGQRERLRPAASLAAVGSGWPPTISSNPSASRAGDAITRPARTAARAASGRRAIAGAALPAAITRSSADAWRHCVERRVDQRVGAHAAIPARTIARRSCRSSGVNASVCVLGIGPGRKAGHDVELLEE